MPTPKASIHIAADPDPLIDRAAGELQRYIRLLFGFTAPIRRTAPKSGSCFLLGTPSCDPRLGDLKRLGPEAFRVRRRRAGKAEICDAVGGSAVAVQWAVYAIIEKWGVHYLVHGDVMPDPQEVGPFRLPRGEISAQPVFEGRTFRLINDMINSSALWSLAEHEALLDQLVKLRFNHVYLGTYAHQPWVHWSYRGIERSEADFNFGFTSPIHEATIGKELLGFPTMRRYTNPDLAGCETYEQRIVATKRFGHGLIAAAQRRGFTVGFNHILTHVPEQMRRHIGRWSKGVRLPKAGPTSTHPHSLGLERDGGDMRFGHLMTPLNPVFVDMIESWLAVHLDEYREMDEVLLTQQEFPSASAGVERCWHDLDRRHGISSHCSLDEMLDRGRKFKFHSAGRGLLQTQGAIIMLRLLDLVINEHKVVDRYLSPTKKISVRFMNHLVTPLVPIIFDPDRVRFIATVDYTASDVAGRIDSLAFAKQSPMKIHLVVSPEDDNVGFLPQMCTRPLHTIVKGMKRHGVSGYAFRHWLVSKLEPAMGYLIDAAWDRSATPAKSMHRQVERVCGAAAVAPMLRAYKMLEACLEETNQTVGIGFMMPRLMVGQWNGPPGDAGLKVIDRLVKKYEKILVPLGEALEATRPRGRRYVRNVIAYVAFGRSYFQVIRQVSRSKACFEQALAERRKGNVFDIEKFDLLLIESADHLDEAVRMLEQGLRIFAADGVQDPSDRATLAGLNAYGLDFLRGKAREVRLQAEQTAALAL